ncbi:AzlC family ABC transporter permease [Acinetobacter equi]|uniref:Branched-chain amino acid ABC transporter permease n=1 Tax=Acinetobacter equi TaxID=1324350 RepID=A0A0N9VEM3_9GAMM|nr:AzlC family ABC transporter permease [Acinetobacter equi]ALH95648.1 branched-chain amino acid ABC transporter permease [Acinetobacter equi]
MLKHPIKIMNFRKGIKDMLPLSVAVIPWAIMVGSLAISAGLNITEAIAMSVLVFAGAAQIMSLTMLMADTSSFVILVMIFFMTTQHYIYGLSLRVDISKMSLLQRISLGFLLTDELYAVSKLHPERSYSYLLGAGFSFYIFWVIFSVVGIFSTFMIKDITAIYLDYSIVAIFLVMSILIIKNMIGIIAVLVSFTTMFILTWVEFQFALIFSSLVGMMIAALLDKEKS